MKKRPSIRQLKYARGIMDEDKTKYQAALDAGFSPSTARVPKLIENKFGFKLAMAQVAGQIGNNMHRLMFELEARDMTNLSPKELSYSLEVISKVYERFASKV